MNPSNNQLPQHNIKPGMDLSKTSLMFNPQGLQGMGGNMPNLGSYMSHLNPGVHASDTYSHMMAGDLSQQEHMKKLREKFSDLKNDIEKLDKNPEKFKTHSLPLARVKKIMKSDEDVRMISAEAPVVFAKACELFIIELTHRAWLHTEEGKRRTLQKNDIAQCIANTDIFDFLIDIIPREEYAKSAIMKKSTMMTGMNFPQTYLPQSMNPLQFPPQFMAQIQEGAQNQQKSGMNPNMLHPSMMNLQNLTQQFSKPMPQPKKDDSH
jgi:nuclear transcription factor Y gamma